MYLHLPLVQINVIIIINCAAMSSTTHGASCLYTRLPIQQAQPSASHKDSGFTKVSCRCHSTIQMLDHVLQTGIWCCRAEDRRIEWMTYEFWWFSPTILLKSQYFFQPLHERAKMYQYQSIQLKLHTSNFI